MSWVKTPAELDQSRARLMCTERTRHTGRHYNDVYGYEWMTGKEPTLRLKT